MVLLEGSMVTGEPISIVMRDLGAQPDEVYVSLFETDLWVLLSKVDVALVHMALHPAEFRQAQDFKMLSEHGVACDTLKITELPLTEKSDAER